MLRGGSSPSITGLEFASTMSYIRNQLLAFMDLGSSSGMSSVAVHGGILRQDAGVMQRFVNPDVVFEDAARHGRDEIDLNVAMEPSIFL
ncbi:hypothetical protein ZWY2020_011422 [Hordeum vulgare]|nr:hypothetical protein ZWY2020_011422 [Hordeum vulgare]